MKKVVLCAPIFELMCSVSNANPCDLNKINQDSGIPTCLLKVDQCRELVQSMRDFAESLPNLCDIEEYSQKSSNILIDRLLSDTDQDGIEWRLVWPKSL